MSVTNSLKRGRLPTSCSENENRDVIVKGRVKAIHHKDPYKCDIELDCQGETVHAPLHARDVSVDKTWAVSQKLTVQSLVQITGWIPDDQDDARLDDLDAAERPSKRIKVESSAESKPGSVFLSNGVESTESRRPNGTKLNGNHSTTATPDSPATLTITHIQILALAQPSLPLLPGGQLSPGVSLSTRLDNRVLDQRAAASGAMFKLFSGMTSLITEFFLSRDFTWLQTPRLRSSHVAGDNEYFHVPYFERDAWLCQHSQHSLQGAIAMDLGRVFDIGPVFRQEGKSDGSGRHLSEFTLLGVNMTYDHDWTEVIDLLGQMLVFVFKNLQERKQYATLLKTVQKYYPSVKPFHIGLDEHGKVPRITFLDAKRMLRDELGLETDDNENFTPAEEAALGVHFLKTPSLHCTSLFVITHFPLHMRQFNSVRDKSDPARSETWDFIAGGLEVCSGSHRISDYDELCTAMRSGATGPPMNPESEAWAGWISMFKAGMPAHAGASFGVNRILQGFLGLDDIREVTLFPRDKTRLAP